MGKIVMLHQSTPLRVTFPDRENHFPRSTNVQPVFDIVPTSKTGCTFVDMDGEVVFSVWERDSKWLSLVRRANFASVLWPF